VGCVGSWKSEEGVACTCLVDGLVALCRGLDSETVTMRDVVVEHRTTRISLWMEMMYCDMVAPTMVSFLC
jgi:hypothetical protein